MSKELLHLTLGSLTMKEELNHNSKPTVFIKNMVLELRPNFACRECELLKSPECKIAICAEIHRLTFGLLIASGVLNSAFKIKENG